MSRHALFLANHQARRCADIADHARALLQANQYQLICPTISKREQVSEAIIAHADQVDCVIVAGGDGSINAALTGLMKANLPLGIIPAGTANDLARTLDIPADTSAAIEIILSNQTQTVDVGLANDHRFINAASFGLSVDITRALNKPFKRRWGPFAYVLAAIRATIKARAFHVEIRSDQAPVYLKTVQLVVGNGRYFGTGMTVHQDARIDDQLLDVYSVGVYHWWSILALLPSLRRGTHASQKQVFNAKGSCFVFKTLRPRPITADGEILTQTPATFSIKPRAIRIYAPAQDEVSSVIV